MKCCMQASGAPSATAFAAELEQDSLLGDMVAIHFGRWGALKAFQVGQGTADYLWPG